MNGFDIDGVITIGLLPQFGDIIITGRSYEEMPETMAMFVRLGIKDAVVLFNPVKFNEKTRESSGDHKVKCLTDMHRGGFLIDKYFEDDPIQANIIEKKCPWVKVVRIVHNLTNKENERHLIV